MHSMGRY